MSKSAASPKIGGLARPINFTATEIENIYECAERLTGGSQRGRYRKEIIITNVEKRMHENGMTDLSAYLFFAERDPVEKMHLLSSLTIHTTSWFREPIHYTKLESLIIENISEFQGRPLNMMCSACASGEEVYSFGLVLESIRANFAYFDYRIVGFDIDPVSIDRAKKAVYKTVNNLDAVPPKLHKYLLMGTGKAEGKFTLDKEVRKRCEFKTFSLIDRWPGTESFDIVTCRNALIYFESDVMEKIVRGLTGVMKPNGLLVVGTSDFIDAQKNKLKDIGKSIFVFEGMRPLSKYASSPKVLIVDDSATIRITLTKLLTKAGFRVDAVESAKEASEYLRKESVSLITLDLHMPGTDGQTWLNQQRASGLKTPVVVISAADPHEAKGVLTALSNGAQDYFDKDRLLKDPKIIMESLHAIIEGYEKPKVELKVAPAPEANETTSPPKPLIKVKRPQLILLGASTGGTEALKIVLDRMPEDSPPIIVIQHITSVYAKAFHEKLAASSGLKMVEAENGVLLRPGHIYMAHGDYHVQVTRLNDTLTIKNSNFPPVNGIRPCIDYLFKSASFLGNRLMAGVLTGMGRDGAEGLLEIKKIGGLTFAQNQESCVVFGMPKVAISLNAASIVGNLYEIRMRIKEAIAGDL